MGQREWNSDATSSPNAALHGHVSRARWHKERDSCFVQVVARPEQRRRHTARKHIELVVAEGAVSRNDRRSCQKVRLLPLIILYR